MFFKIKSVFESYLSPMKFRLLHYFCFLFIGLSTCFSQNGKSEITITQPITGTVWSIPEMVTLEWSVKNIDSEKSTRFFLIRDEMVVQELGSFKNLGVAEGIELAKNIGSGDRYQVVGIELFPEDKFQIAKFVTPFFTITNKASDERKKKREQAREEANPILVKKKKKEKRKKNKVKPIPEKLPEQKSPNTKEEKPKQIKRTEQPEIQPATVREEFEGRKISYTKDLEFNSTDITVKIWDHGRQDGDIVSIYLNGTSVVSKHYLTYYKREFKIKLDPNRSNDLFLYAHNLGASPPNTVSIEITDGTKSENMILNSDLKSCEAVMISVKK